MSAPLTATRAGYCAFHTLATRRIRTILLSAIQTGDSFSAGDVILEIETDKAQMDVEAQDDGILFKIIEIDGAKAVQVGDRIGVLADADDDLSTLEMPTEEKKSSPSAKPARKDRPSPQEELSGGMDKTETSPSAMEAPPSSKPNADAAAGGAADTARAKQNESDKSSSSESSSSKSTEKTRQEGKPQKQTYPLYPSVQHLLLQNGMSKEDANKIPASGPGGRLLKGDVLAYMGKIAKNYSSDQSKRISKMGHLDLSNIEIVSNKKADKAPAAAVEAKAAPPPDTEIALPVSLTAVIATQKRVQDTLGIYLPLSTFVARASELANEDLPLSRNRTPTADELFNSIIGLDKVASKTSRGHYVPQITGLPTTLTKSSKPARKSDIIDLLSSKPAAPKKASKTLGATAAVTPHSVFSVMAAKGEEKRIQTYLERVKNVLEADPGRLVL